MGLQEKREEVIKTGQRLLHMGLTARTWGNISCRIDHSHFLITPSGRSYLDLRPEEVVIVNIEDGRSWGTVRPSSEKGVHQAIYKERPDVNYIIHTHQPEASVLCGLELGIHTETAASVFGDAVVCAPYGFPGSEALQRNVEAVMQANKAKAMLLAHHGVLCFDTDMENALRIAVSVEMMSSFLFRKAFENFVGRPMTVNDSIYEDILRTKGKSLPKEIKPLYSSERSGNDMIFYFSEKEPITVSFKQRKLTPEQRIHQQIYMARQDIGAITHCDSPAITAYSALRARLEPYLDDFAQLNGCVMNWGERDEKALAAALAENHGVFVADQGALCCGNSRDDANALATVAEKNARTKLFSVLFPEEKLSPLAAEDCEKMRRFYLDSYSKLF